MEHLTAINITFVLIGLLLNTLVDWVKIQKANKGKFNPKKWVHENSITIFVTIIVAFLSLYFVDFATVGLEIEVHKDALFYQAHSFISGFTPYITLKSVLKIEIQNEQNVQ